MFTWTFLLVQDIVSFLCINQSHSNPFTTYKDSARCPMTISDMEKWRKRGDLFVTDVKGTVTDATPQSSSPELYCLASIPSEFSRPVTAHNQFWSASALPKKTEAGANNWQGKLWVSTSFQVSDSRPVRSISNFSSLISNSLVGFYADDPGPESVCVCVCRQPDLRNQWGNSYNINWHTDWPQSCGCITYHFF